ncbi:hypothetical protein B0H21DRAFT_885376 [Amylocystis lapponica]|nr:hypothetical protein B0H21DRAFT_885376 [Amylocystis lapponica]
MAPSDTFMEDGSSDKEQRSSRGRTNSRDNDPGDRRDRTPRGYRIPRYRSRSEDRSRRTQRDAVRHSRARSASPSRSRQSRVPSTDRGFHSPWKHNSVLNVVVHPHDCFVCEDYVAHSDGASSRGNRSYELARRDQNAYTFLINRQEWYERGYADAQWEAAGVPSDAGVERMRDRIAELEIQAAGLNEQLALARTASGAPGAVLGPTFRPAPPPSGNSGREGPAFLPIGQHMGPLAYPPVGPVGIHLQSSSLSSSAYPPIGISPPDLGRASGDYLSHSRHGYNPMGAPGMVHGPNMPVPMMGPGRGGPPNLNNSRLASTGKKSPAQIAEAMYASSFPPTTVEIDRLIKLTRGPGFPRGLVRLITQWIATMPPEAARTSVQSHLVANWTLPAWMSHEKGTATKEVSSLKDDDKPTYKSTYRQWQKYYLAHPLYKVRGIGRDKDNRPLAAHVETFRQVMQIADPTEERSSYAKDIVARVVGVFAVRGRYETHIRTNAIQLAPQLAMVPIPGPFAITPSLEDVASHLAACGVNDLAVERFYAWAEQYIADGMITIPPGPPIAGPSNVAQAAQSQVPVATYPVEGTVGGTRLLYPRRSLGPEGEDVRELGCRETRKAIPYRTQQTSLHLEQGLRLVAEAVVHALHARVEGLVNVHLLLWAPSQCEGKYTADDMAHRWAMGVRGLGWHLACQSQACACAKCLPHIRLSGELIHTPDGVIEDEDAFGTRLLLEDVFHLLIILRLDGLVIHKVLLYTGVLHELEAGDVEGNGVLLAANVVNHNRLRLCVDIDEASEQIEPSKCDSQFGSLNPARKRSQAEGQSCQTFIVSWHNDGGFTWHPLHEMIFAAVVTAAVDATTATALALDQTDTWAA